MFFYKLYQKFKVIKRFNKILLILFKAGFSVFLIKIGVLKHVPFAARLDKNQIEQQVLPIKLRLVLEKLGPIYVKLGQILSTRSDLLPQAYIRELEKLQTSVGAFSYTDAKKVFYKNFKKFPEQIFKTFETKPFASASLGQVYKATLKSGEKVAVKVQRPKAKELIKIDIQVLLMLAHFVEKHIPGAKEKNIAGVVKEFQRWTINELDYRKEAVNCEIFTNFFKSDPNIYSPKVFWDYSSDSVLTLEFVTGNTLGDVLAKRNKNIVNKKMLAHHLANSFIKQYFEYGYFHADPHPGNIIILPQSKLMFLDFGMVGLLDEELRALAAGAFLALVQRDVEKIIAILLQVEQNYDERAQNKSAFELVNINALRKEISLIVLEWSSTGQAGEFTKLFYQIVEAAVKNGIVVPVDLTLFSKSIMTLDAVAHDLDPELKIEKWEKPMVEEIILSKFKTDRIKTRTQEAFLAVDEIIKKLPDSATAIVGNLERGRFGMELNTEQLLEYEKLLNWNSRVNTYGTFFSALLIAFALIYQSSSHPLNWKISIPGWGLYLGLAIIVLFFLRVRWHNKV